MRLSLKWVNEFVEISDYLSKASELAALLTRAGFEVEAIHDSRSQFHQVVVGHILEKDKHPNADKLSVCRVTTGQNQVHQIVCGAQNHKAGDRVVLALPGAILPGGLNIKKSSLRGIESGGMLCSFKELGLDGPSEGIAILDEKTPVGQAFAEVWGLDDVIFELKVTPNRADGLSHYGLAREIGALLGRNLKNQLPDILGEKGTSSGPVQVQVGDASLSPRYMGRYISHVRVQPSPQWLQKRLESVGLKSINNVVDVTNLILMELGQPLHAFDADQIKGNKLIIARAQKLEAFTTLDQKSLKLSEDNLTIRDSERPLCLAGVMGGLNSGTTVDTKNVFLEAAYFLPDSVRKTSRTFGLDSDSSYRFSRGVDSSLTSFALARATKLIEELASGKASPNYVDIDNRKTDSKKIEVSEKLISQRLGYPAQLSKMKDYAQRLHFKIESEKADTLVLVPPSFRFDMNHPMDFVEEYARLDGYENIPETLPAQSFSPTAHDAIYLRQQSLAKLAAAAGYSQALNFAFCSQTKESQFVGDYQKLAKLGLGVTGEFVKLLNPLNEELNVMRSTLTWGLIQNILHNYRHGVEAGQLFEMGSVFSKVKGEITETPHAAFAVWGQESRLWKSSQPIPPVYRLKSLLENWLKNWGLTSWNLKQGTEENSLKFLHDGQFAIIEFRNQPIGWIGSLHPLYLMENKVRVPVALMEINLKTLLGAEAGKRKIVTPVKHPVVVRDLALVMPDDLAVGEVIKAIKHKGAALLLDSQILDVFKGEPLELGKKSVSIRLVWQDPTQTLQEEAVNKLQTDLLKELEQKFPVALR
ncbi:MAG: phenylalanine--tRNA ligase subunit beta [Bdellovibrionales bacterium]